MTLKSKELSTVKFRNLAEKKVANNFNNCFFLAITYEWISGWKVPFTWLFAFHSNESFYATSFVMKSWLRSLRAKEIVEEIEWQKSSTARCKTCRLRNSTLSLLVILFYLVCQTRNKLHTKLYTQMQVNSVLTAVKIGAGVQKPLTSRSLAWIIQSQWRNLQQSQSDRVLVNSS